MTMILSVHHLMGAAEIGELFGVSRQRVQQLVTRPDFPAAAAELAMGKVWDSEDVRRYGIKAGRLKSEGSADDD